MRRWPRTSILNCVTSQYNKNFRRQRLDIAVWANNATSWLSARDCLRPSSCRQFASRSEESGIPTLVTNKV